MLMVFLDTVSQSWVKFVFKRENDDGQPSDSARFLPVERIPS